MRITEAEKEPVRRNLDHRYRRLRLCGAGEIGLDDDTMPELYGL
jgi:hypothetical protein